MRYVRHLPLAYPLIRHGIGDLIALYEGNYRRLMTLVPGLRLLASGAVSRVEECVDLHLEVLERHKYTTILTLTHLFDAEGPAPDLTIRVYHDACVAEVLACGTCEQSAGLPAGHGLPATLELKWGQNLFLERWLTYCLERGHSFSVAAA